MKNILVYYLWPTPNAFPDKNIIKSRAPFMIYRTFVKAWCISKLSTSYFK